MMNKTLITTGLLSIITLHTIAQDRKTESLRNQSGAYKLTILGTSQDAGYPQIGCRKPCCMAIREGRQTNRYVTSLAISDHTSGKYWLFEATPDISEQLEIMQSKDKNLPFQLPAGIFLTHGHIGHYTGLMQLGREAYGAKGVEVFAMPRMEQFLANNGPWSQLLSLGNIAIKPIKADSTFQLSKNLSVTPIHVPHRDEFTETVGFLIQGTKKLLFIPDIDKWEKWDRSLDSLIREVDLALIDGTFFDIDELPGRDMREIPHPFVLETMKLLETLPLDLKQRVMFIHFNHTNPLIRSDSPQHREVIRRGFRVAVEGQSIGL
jgi:pyrroloquinoline quinone biosynthesis protein B